MLKSQVLNNANITTTIDENYTTVHYTIVQPYSTVAIKRNFNSKSSIRIPY